MKHAVASTGLLVAAIRAAETASKNPLFIDSYAHHLAGPEGRQLLAEYLRVTAAQVPPIIELRTWYWDRALQHARDNGASQFVILAAGRDARAYRLRWRDSATIYEIDQPEVIADKNAVLATEEPTCTRSTIGIDLADDWPTALLSHGFSPTTPTVWLIEGLLQYLAAPAVTTLFERLDTLSAHGSTAFYDVIGKTLLDAPFFEPVHQFMTDLGAPWIFGTDTPGALIEPLGWTAEITDVAEPGYHRQLWPAPPQPLDIPDLPRGFFVAATKN
jgi:methyltransferase (TIGR00027 family)